MSDNVSSSHHQLRLSGLSIQLRWLAQPSAHWKAVVRCFSLFSEKKIFEFRAKWYLQLSFYACQRAHTHYICDSVVAASRYTGDICFIVFTINVSDAPFPAQVGFEPCVLDLLGHMIVSNYHIRALLIEWICTQAPGKDRLQNLHSVLESMTCKLTVIEAQRFCVIMITSEWCYVCGSVILGILKRFWVVCFDSYCNYPEVIGSDHRVIRWLLSLFNR